VFNRYGFAFMPLLFAGAPIQLPMFDGGSGDGSGQGNGGNAGDKGNKGNKGKKSKLSALLDEDEDLQDEIDALIEKRLARERRKSGNRNDDGQTNEELESLRQFKADKEREDQEKQKNYEKALESERTKFTKKEETYKQRQDRLAKELRQERVRGRLVSIAAKLGAVDPDDVADLLEKRVDLDDDFKIVVRDAKDATRTASNADGDDMSIDELVSELLEKKPHLAKAAEGEPAGARGGRTRDAEAAGKGSGKKADLATLEKAFKDAKEAAEKNPNAGNLTKMQQAKRAFEKAQKAA
jgi:hypothetical protein